jgi:hypothetical protein
LHDNQFAFQKICQKRGQGCPRLPRIQTQVICQDLSQRTKRSTIQVRNDKRTDIVEFNFDPFRPTQTTGKKPRDHGTPERWTAKPWLPIAHLHLHAITKAPNTLVQDFWTRRHHRGTTLLKTVLAKAGPYCRSKEASKTKAGAGKIWVTGRPPLLTASPPMRFLHRSAAEPQEIHCLVSAALIDDSSNSSFPDLRLFEFLFS